MDKKDILDKKIIGKEQLKRLLAYWNFKDQKVSLAYGTFDVLKPGTIDMIIQASSKGDVLLVAVKTDELVGKHKGAGNPTNHHCNRALAVASLQLVSAVHVVNTEDPSEFIDMVKPTAVVYCKHAGDVETRAFDKVHEWGGEVIRLDTDRPIKYHKEDSCCD